MWGLFHQVSGDPGFSSMCNTESSLLEALGAWVVSYLRAPPWGDGTRTWLFHWGPPDVIWIFGSLSFSNFFSVWPVFPERNFSMPCLGLLWKEGLESKHPTCRLARNPPIISLCLQSGTHTPIPTLTPCAGQGVPKCTVTLVHPYFLPGSPEAGQNPFGQARLQKEEDLGV